MVRFGVTSSMGVCERSAEWMETLTARSIKEFLLPITFQTTREQILQQDGTPSHTSAPTSKFLKVKKVKVLQDWPAQSPDMNIIEHVLGKMKEEVWKMKPKNLDELCESCKTAFFAIPDDFIKSFLPYIIFVCDKTFVQAKSDLSVLIN